MSIYEYDEEKHMRQEREAEYERGLTDGISQGEQKKLLNLIQTKLKKGKAISQIAEELEESEAVIKELVKNSCCN